MIGPAAEADDRLEIEDLRARLREAEETLDAIRSGEVDAVVVGGAGGHQVYTLENADRPYRLLIEQMQEGAVTLTADGIMLYGNRHLGTLLGVPPARLVGTPFRRFVADRERAVLAALMGESAAGGSRGELTLRAEDGVEIPVHISIADLPEGDSRILCAIVTDLTQQRERNRELAEANARLRSEMAERERAEDQLRQSQKMEAVGQLTGGLAHDFNNMLAGVMGSLDLMKRRLASGDLDKVARYIEAAMTSAQRAAALTARLLAFGRRQSLDLRAVDVNRIVTGLEDLLQRTLGEGVDVITQTAADLWTGVTDANQLENALVNLAINARDAMPDGGELTVATRNFALSAAEARRFEGLAPGDYVAVEVSDTGTGMSPDTLKKAFEPFFTTKPIGQGTGLGLSMIYGFAKQTKGFVTIDSVEEQGTTVRLYLPRHVGTESPAAEKERVAPKGEGETVLVVEDEGLVRMLVVDVLLDLGYQPIEAVSGDKAVPILQSDQRIDLLVTDVGMPGMNGRQLAEVARRLRPDLKVLFVTGYAEKAAVRGDFLGENMDIVTKPFAFETLAAKIRQMIAG